MWRDHDAPLAWFALVPMRRGARAAVMVPLARRLAADPLCPRVTVALLRRAPHTATRRRPATPVASIRRRVVVKRWSCWRDAETEPVVAERLVLRPFGRVSLAAPPDATTLRRGAPRRHRLARRRGEAAADAGVLAVARQRGTQAERVRAARPRRHGEAARRVSQALAPEWPLVPRVIGHAHRRGLEGAVVPAQETRLRLGVPHPPVIPRHQPGTIGACGRQRRRAEGKGGSRRRAALVAHAGSAPAAGAASLAGQGASAWCSQARAGHRRTGDRTNPPPDGGGAAACGRASRAGSAGGAAAGAGNAAAIRAWEGWDAGGAGAS
jgi:hypothetical protein